MHARATETAIMVIVTVRLVGQGVRAISINLTVPTIALVMASVRKACVCAFNFTWAMTAVSQHTHTLSLTKHAHVDYLLFSYVR
jgi:hypothetical protein